jgi:hypothetical protein
LQPAEPGGVFGRCYHFDSLFSICFENDPAAIGQFGFGARLGYHYYPRSYCGPAATTNWFG